MDSVLKNLFSLVLPISVLILIPLSIEDDFSSKHETVFLIGILIMATGLLVMGHTISLFITIGKGTLAPWNPTQKLVIKGLYAYVRNPMIIGVMVVLTGESIAIESWNILVWLLIFIAVNNVYFLVYEEPNLIKRFGQEYQEYKRNVPRWIPRFKPYKPQ